MNSDTKDNLKKNVYEYYCGDDEFFDEAYDKVMKIMPTVREVVPHVCDVEKDDLFTDIDKAIAFLHGLKAKGYTSLEERWSGYEDNYFVAVKNEIETDEEYFRRLGRIVKGESMNIANRCASRIATQKRIRELEDEIRRIKKNMVC